jgi:hypothetical protein
MDDQHKKLEEILDEVVQLTGDSAFIDEMIAIEATTREAVDHVALSDDLTAVRLAYRQREARFLASLHQSIARLEAAFSQCKADNVGIAKLKEEEYIQSSLELELQLRTVKRDLEKWGHPVSSEPEQSAHERRKHIESLGRLVRLIHEQWYESHAKAFHRELATLRSIRSGYRIRRSVRRIKVGMAWLFWSLLVLAIGLGALLDQIPKNYVTALLIPTIGWLIGLVAQPIIDLSDKEGQRAYLRAQVEDLGSQMFWLPVRISLIDNHLKRLAQQDGQPDRR